MQLCYAHSKRFREFVTLLLVLSLRYGVAGEICVQEIFMKPSTLLAVIVITVVPVTPSLAKKHHTAANSQSSAANAARAQETFSRDEAIQQCSTEAAKWRYSDWQTAQITNYRACMTRHGQPFE